MDAIALDRLLSRHRPSRPLYSGRDGIKMVETRSGAIRVRVVGEGALAVVFVCDAPVLIEHYDGLFELLRRDYKAVCIELPGMGFSRPSGDFDFGLAAQASAVREVLSAESISRAILAFGCVGAYLALLLAHDEPELVRGVIFMQAGSWEEEQQWARRVDFRGRGLLAKPFLGQLLVHASRNMMAKRWFEKASGDTARVESFVRESRAAFDAGASWSLASLVQGYFERPAPEFHGVEQRSRLLWGALDRTHKHTDPRSALTYLPRGEFVLFERSGHFPELEEPERFATVLHELAAETA